MVIGAMQVPMIHKYEMLEMMHKAYEKWLTSNHTLLFLVQ